MVISKIICPTCGKLLGKNYDATGSVALWCKKCKKEQHIKL